MNRTKYILVFILVVVGSNHLQAQIFKTTKGSIYFKSDAPLELIEATSQKLNGAINSSNRTFAFSIPISSFMGFNNPLQREHFNENYMESKAYHHSTFTGKIIEKIDFSKDGKYTVRAKGKLNIHGVIQERIIKSQLEIKEGKIVVDTSFSILLDEHKIRVPKIVYQKIAKEIFVKVHAVFEK